MIREYYTREKHEYIKESRILLLSSRKWGREIFQHLNDFGMKNVKIVDWSSIDSDINDANSSIPADDEWKNCCNELGWLLEEICANNKNNANLLLKEFSSFRMIISCVKGSLRKRINRICSSAKVPLLELSTASTFRNIVIPMVKEIETPSKITIDSKFNINENISPSFILMTMVVDFLKTIDQAEIDTLDGNTKKQQMYLDKIIELTPSYYMKDEMNSLSSKSSISEKSKHVKNLQDLLLDTFKRKLELLESRYSSFEVNSPSNSLHTLHHHDQHTDSAPTNPSSVSTSSSSNITTTQFLVIWDNILQSNTQMKTLYSMILLTCSLPQSAIVYIYAHLLSTLKPIVHETMSLQLVSLLAWLRNTIQYRGIPALMNDLHSRLTENISFDARTTTPVTTSTNTSTSFGTTILSEKTSQHIISYSTSSSSLTTLNTSSSSSCSQEYSTKSLLTTTFVELYNFCKHISTFPYSLETLCEEELTRQLAYHILSILSPRLRKLSPKETVYLEALLLDAENWIELYGGYEPYGYIYQVATSMKKAVPNMIGHSGGITALLSLPNGTFFSSSQDKTMKLWNPRIGEVLYTIHCYHAMVTAMILLADDWLGVGYDTGGLSIYQISTKILIKQLSGHTRKITSLSTKWNRHIPPFSSMISPIHHSSSSASSASSAASSTYSSSSSFTSTTFADIVLISASADGSMKVWNIDTGECIHRYHHTTSIHCMMILSMRMLPYTNIPSTPVVPSKRNNTNEVPTTPLLPSLQSPAMTSYTMPLSSPAYSSPGTEHSQSTVVDEEDILITGSAAGLFIYQHDQPVIGKQVKDLTAAVYSLCVLPPQTMSNTKTTRKKKDEAEAEVEHDVCIVIGCYGYVLLYNLTREEIVKKVTLGNVPIYSICCMPITSTNTNINTNTSATTSSTTAAKTPNSVHTPASRMTTSSSSSSSSSSTTDELLQHSIIMGGEDGHLYQYNIVKERIIAMKKASGIITSIIITMNQVVLYATEEDYQIHTWSVVNDSTPSLRSLAPHPFLKHPIHPSCPADNTSSSSSSSSLYQRRTANAYTTTTTTHSSSSISSDTAHHDTTAGVVGHAKYITFLKPLSAHRLLSASQDNTLCVWDISTGQCVQRLCGHIDSVLCAVEFPALQSRLASGGGSYDKSIRIWDLCTGQCLTVLQAHRLRVLCLCLFPDREEYLASGSADRCILVWNIVTGQCMHSLEGHSQNITTLIATREGQIISMAKHDPIVHLWQCQLTTDTVPAATNEANTAKTTVETAAETAEGTVEEEETAEEEEGAGEQPAMSIPAIQHLEVHNMKHFDPTDYIIGLFQLADGRLVVEGNYSIFILEIPSPTRLSSNSSTTKKVMKDNEKNEKTPHKQLDTPPQRVAKKMFFFHDQARILSIEQNTIITMKLDHSELTRITISPTEYTSQSCPISLDRMFQYIHSPPEGCLQLPRNVYLTTNRIKDILPYHTEEEMVGYFIASTEEGEENTIVLTGLTGELHFTKVLPRKQIYDEWLGWKVASGKKRQSLYGPMDTGSTAGRRKVEEEEENERNSFYSVEISQEECESSENMIVLFVWIVLVNMFMGVCTWK